MHKIIAAVIIITSALGFSLCLAGETKTEDKNKDGKPDLWIFYDDNNRPLKIENDRNFDDKLDLWIIYGEKGARVTQIDLNFDGRPDMYSYYRYGQRIKLEIDTDYDGKLDQINEYSDDRLVKMQRTGKDKKLETVFDITSRYSSQQKNTQYYETNSQTLGDSKALPEKQKPE